MKRKPELRAAPQNAKRRTAVLNTEEIVKALLWWPGFHRIAAVMPDADSAGRPRDFPSALVLLFGVLAVSKGSHSLVEAELDDTRLWDLVLEEWQRYEIATGVPEDERFRSDKALRWYHWKYARDTYWSRDDVLDEVLAEFTDTAVTLALDLGYFDPARGSLSRPHRTQCVQGDGTEVRSAYRCKVGEWPDEKGVLRPAIIDPKSNPHGKKAGGPRLRAWLLTDGYGELRACDPHTGAYLERMPVDPDALPGGKYDEDNVNRNIVTFHVRDEHSHSKVTLAVGMDATRNTEAATAMALIDQLSQTTIGDRIRAVIYDKELRGTHIDQLLTEYGYIPVVKVAAAATTAAERADREAAGAGAKAKEMVGGMHEHKTPAGRCTHLLHVVDGAIVEIELDEQGKLIVVGRPTRGQVKRQPRILGGRKYHWNVEYRITCPNGDFSVWRCPHSDLGDTDTKIAENVRIFPVGDPVFDDLGGVRNDTEAYHSRQKAAQRHKRAMSIGSAKVLLESTLFAVLENAVTWYHQIGHQHIAADDIERMAA